MNIYSNINGICSQCNNQEYNSDYLKLFAGAKATLRQSGAHIREQKKVVKDPKSSSDSSGDEASPSRKMMKNKMKKDADMTPVSPDEKVVPTIVRTEAEGGAETGAHDLHTNGW